MKLCAAAVIPFFSGGLLFYRVPSCPHSRICGAINPAESKVHNEMRVDENTSLVGGVA